MTDTKLTAERIAQLSPKRLTLLALELQDQLAEERRRRQEPIAVVGVACRFPGGADSPEAYWQLMRDGRDVIREVPEDRWNLDELYDPDPDAPGKMSTRFGGFMDRIDLFDAELFGVSPREAETMDPQQRLLLEVCWEALERAGIAPDSLRGSKSGVFVGVCNNDYGRLVLQRGHAAVDAYVASGSAFSVVGGRVAYTLGLEGATMVIDTACSSSLIAIHEACQHLRERSVSLALAGGVNVICAPDTTIALSKAHMMAPDGRCKTFDDSANGFVRSEGCGVLVLKRLSDAQASGDTILAVIRGSAVNQDGRSSGLTVPNGAAQAAVIRAALASGDLSPSQVAYVEAHGTGTSLGDPIEIRALGEALCAERPADRPLIVGSVKTNIGHLESAAGVAGVIKAILAIQHGEIPPNLHLREPNRDVAWDTLAVRIPTELTPWPKDSERIAGISSFGFSGTNAHVIVAEPPPPSATDGEVDNRPAHILPLSAKTPAALDGAIERFADFFSTTDVPAADVCHTAIVGRAKQRERAVVVAADSAEFASALRSGAVLRPKVARRSAADAEVAFLFTGSGAQTPQMGRALYAASPVFRAALDECAKVLEPLLDVPLLSVLNCSEEDAPRLLHRTRYLHPALFSVEYALAALWRSWGIEPAAVAGHSLGEYVAACVAGVFDLDVALPLVVERARLIDELPAGGAMAAIFAERANVEERIAALGLPLDVAAVNGPANVVVSGPESAVDALLDAFKSERVDGRRLQVTHAFHSRLLDPMLGKLEARAALAAARTPQITLISNVTGKPFGPGERPDAAYWKTHARQPVLFADSLRSLEALGYRWFVEIGPHPTLLSMVPQSVTAGDVLLVPSLRRGADEWRQILEALGTLYVHGARVDWDAFDRPYKNRTVVAPTYAFDRKRFWISKPKADAAAPEVFARGSSLLGSRLDVPTPTFRTVFDRRSDAYIFDHRVSGKAMTSAPLFAALALEAATTIRPGKARCLRDLSISVPLPLSPDSGTTVYTVADEQPGDVIAVRVLTRSESATKDWTVHARVDCRLAGSPERKPETVLPADLDAHGYVKASATDFYAGLVARGIDLGPGVAGIREIWHGRSGDVVARIEFPNGPRAVAEVLHPAVADAALQALGAAIAARQSPTEPGFLLAGIDAVEPHAGDGGPVWCRAVVRPGHSASERIGDVIVYRDDGTPVLAMTGVKLKQAGVADSAADGGWGYALQWPARAPDVKGLRFGTAGALRLPEDIRAKAAAVLQRVAKEYRLDSYDEALPAIDGLACRYIVAAFERLGFAELDVLAPAELRARIAAKHERLFQRLFEILVDGNFLTRVGDGYRWTGNRPPAVEPSSLKERFPTCRAEITVLERCGERLAEVLSGDVDPVSLLFSEGLRDSLRQLYRETPFAQTMNRTMVAAVDAALERIPAGRPVRILEVGAGTGGTTAFVLPALRGRRATYCFTDVSPAFLTSAAAEFAEFPFVSYQLFDVERSAVEQGLDAGSFDIVIAANAIHATRDIGAAVRHAQELLAPHGTLLLLEGTTREPWVDLTFGLTDGWWRFNDTAVRPTYPLLTRDAWRGLLKQQGFADVAIAPEAQPGERSTSQALIIARKVDGAAARSSMDLLADGRSRRWLIVGADTAVGAALARELPHATALPGGGVTSPEEITSAAPQDGTLEVVYVSASDASPHECARSGLAFMQSIARGGSPALKLWLVTSGAVPLGAVTSPAAGQAPLWGLGRGYALEHPETWGGLIDVDPNVPAEDSAWQVIEHVCAGDGEDQVAYRSGERHVARLAAAPIAATERGLHLDENGAYLITGGLGGLGLALARWLTERGARHLVLTSRTGLPAGDEGADRQAQIAAMEERGARVQIATVDVADRNAMSELLNGLDRQGTPLRGVFHAAAAMSSAPLLDLTVEQLDGMFAAKVDGTLVLDELTRARQLDVFVLYSSTTALLGVRGLAHYAAANQFMDVIAHRRRAEGHVALAVNWGTWDIMRVASAEDRESFLRGGQKPMRVDDALLAMERLCAAGAVQHTVADIDWTRLKSVYEARRARPMLELVGQSAAVPAAAAAEADRRGASSGFAQLSAAARRDAVISKIREAVAEVLRLDARRLTDLREGFFDMGMDSLMAVELKTRLEQSFERPLPSTLAFNYPNIEAVAEFLEQELFGSSAPPEQPAPPPEPTRVEEAAATDTAVDDDGDVAIEQRLAEKLRRLGF